MASVSLASPPHEPLATQRQAAANKLPTSLMAPWLGLIGQAYMEVRTSKVRAMGLVWSCAAIAFSLLVSSVGIYDQERLLIDISIAAQSLFAQGFGAFAGLYWLAGSVQRRSAYLLLAKPISKEQFLLGRAVGIWLGILPSLLMMASMLAGLLWLMGYAFPNGLLAAWLMILMEAGLAVAVAAFWGAGVQLPIAIMATSITLLLGHLHGEMQQLALHPKQPWLLQQALQAATLFLPNLSSLSFRQAAANHLPVAWQTLVAALGYSGGYMVVCLLLAAMVFQRRAIV